MQPWIHRSAAWSCILSLSLLSYEAFTLSEQKQRRVDRPAAAAAATSLATPLEELWYSSSTIGKIRNSYISCTTTIIVITHRQSGIDRSIMDITHCRCFSKPKFTPIDYYSRTCPTSKQTSPPFERKINAYTPSRCPSEKLAGNCRFYNLYLRRWL